MEIGIKFVMTHLEIKKTNLPGFLNDFHIQTLIFFFPCFSLCSVQFFTRPIALFIFDSEQINAQLLLRMTVVLV